MPATADLLDHECENCGYPECILVNVTMHSRSPSGDSTLVGAYWVCPDARCGAFEKTEEVEMDDE